MAMLLLRSGGVSGTQKVPLSALTYTKEGSSSNDMIQDDNSHHQHQQRSSRSSRKSKNGQKKIPQRGLGVAQLEKLRLEEQQKQEAACLASLQRAHVLPPLTGALHSQAALHPQGNSLVFSPSYCPQIKGRSLDHHPHLPFMSTTNNCKMSDSIISMANLQSLNFKHQMPAVGLGNSSPQQQSPREENRTLSRNSSLAKSSEPVESCVTSAGVANTGFVSGLWPAQNGSREDSTPFMNQEMDMRKANMFVLRSHNSSSLPNDLRFFEPLLRSPAQSRKLPVVSISSSGATMQLEPPSNQSYTTTPPWTEEDRVAGIKRTWPFSQDNPGCLIQSKATRLNVDSGIHVKPDEIANPNPDRFQAAKQEHAGIFRNSLDISLEALKKKQANSELASPGSKQRSELSFSCDSGSTPKVCCVSQATMRDSCSSSSLQHGFTLNWKSSENDISSQEIETPDGAFLTLGLPQSTNGDFQGNELYCKSIQNFATHETNYEPRLSTQLSTHLYQETSGGLSTTTAFQSDGLLKHATIISTDSRQHEEQSLPFYKFLSIPSDKGTADFISRDNKFSSGKAKESIDLNLSLSL